MVIFNLGEIAFRLGNLVVARELLLKSMMKCCELADKAGIAHAIYGLAKIASDCKKVALAATLLGIEERIRQMYGEPRRLSDVNSYNELVAKLRSELTLSEFDSAWTQFSTTEVNKVVDWVQHSCKHLGNLKQD